MKELVGVGVALATPMKDDYAVNYHALEKLITHVVDGGVDYLVVMGTTGEAPVLSWVEKLKILEFVFEKTNEKTPIVFGHGGNNTFNLIERTKDLRDFDLTAILSASPYYSRPSQEGIIRHYQMLGDAFPCPIILYNVPTRTGSNMEAATTLKLAEHENIIGIKEAADDEHQIRTILNERPKDFLFLSGNDDNVHELIKSGSDGIISVVANVLPAEFSKLIHGALDGNFSDSYNEKLSTSYELCSAEGNPSSLKAGLEAAGICKRTVKPPLFDGSDQLVNDWKVYLKSL